MLQEHLSEFDYYFKTVLKMLSNYDDLNENDLDFLMASTPEQGIEHFTNKVIPAVEKYAFSISN
ncbi:MAG: hypothetical protein AB7V77_02665 [Candidatus Woesearchaeota archaeon]